MLYYAYLIKFIEMKENPNVMNVNVIVNDTHNTLFGVT